MSDINNEKELTEAQKKEAFNYLYDTYGYMIHSWTEKKLEEKIKDFWKSKEK